VTFVDTSAIYAVLDRADPNHPQARQAVAQLRAEDAQLVTHAYVLVEVVALVQRRLGLDTVRRFVDDLLPIMDVIHVDAALCAEALEALLAAGQRSVSLVDRTSFLIMRRHGIRRAFTFDADFAAAGFEVIPAA
jgi:uncharacterized protein